MPMNVRCHDSHLNPRRGSEALVEHGSNGVSNTDTGSLAVPMTVTIGGPLILLLPGSVRGGVPDEDAIPRREGVDPVEAPDVGREATVRQVVELGQREGRHVVKLVA
jgi:hypothetical protein